MIAHNGVARIYFKRVWRSDSWELRDVPATITAKRVRSWGRVFDRTTGNDLSRYYAGRKPAVMIAFQFTGGEVINTAQGDALGHTIER